MKQQCQSKFLLAKINYHIKQLDKNVLLVWHDLGVKPNMMAITSCFYYKNQLSPERKKMQPKILLVGALLLLTAGYATAGTPAMNRPEQGKVVICG